MTVNMRQRKMAWWKILGNLEAKLSTYLLKPP